MNSKKIMLIFMTIIIVISLSIISKYKLKSINKKEIDVSKFIETVDEVSDNKVQINWKYICAIVGVKEKNVFKNISEEEIKEVANMFLYESKNGYKLKTLDKVLEGLDFTNNEKLRVKTYVDNLKYHGLVPRRIKEDTNYTKFISEIKPKAIENYKKYKILPSITIAQAILESAWGESSLTQNANNLFGIKADSRWNGDFVNFYQGMKDMKVMEYLMLKHIYIKRMHYRELDIVQQQINMGIKYMQKN